MIVICTPTRESVYGGFAYDLFQLAQYQKDVLYVTEFGTILSNLRMGLVEKALESGASHVLFIDSDMRFPHDVIEQLLKADKDIVGANCSQRVGHNPTARKGENFVMTGDKAGLEEVDVLGFGVTLIKRKVFEKMEKPWFAMPWDGKKHVGEDVFFCVSAKELGFSVWVDHDLSKKIRHLGSEELKI